MLVRAAGADPDHIDDYRGEGAEAAVLVHVDLLLYHFECAFMLSLNARLRLYHGRCNREQGHRREKRGGAGRRAFSGSGRGLVGVWACGA